MNDKYLGLAENGLPIFQVNEKREFYCIPGCGRKHTHGTGDGHRGAHCDKDNRNGHKNGYYIVGKE